MRHHYAHHSDANCVYKNIIYKPETDEHKQSKIIIKNLIETNKLIIYTSCYCNRKIRFDPDKVYVSLEAFFQDSNGNHRYADVGVFDKKTDEMIYVIEIFHTHKTKDEHRPNINWVELKTTKFLEYLEEGEVLSIKCVRDNKYCDLCEEQYEYRVKYHECIDCGKVKILRTGIRCKNCDSIHRYNLNQKQIKEDKERREKMEQDERDRLKKYEEELKNVLEPFPENVLEPFSENDESVRVWFGDIDEYKQYESNYHKNKRLLYKEYTGEILEQKLEELFCARRDYVMGSYMDINVN